MTRKLVIRLEGAAADLGGNGKGVSLRFFGNYAKRLRDAYQRSAQAVLTGTAQETGRLPTRATEVDVRLLDAKAGSLLLDLLPVDSGAQVSLDNLASTALDRFISDLSVIAKDPESTDVPKALRALVATVPGDVRQRYFVMVGNDIEREVELTSNGLGHTAGSVVLASVEQIRVTVRGVICVPRPAVILDTDDGRIQAVTSLKWMDAAWAGKDRNDLVATIVTNSSGVRLLAIRPAKEQEERTRVPSIVETLNRFDGVLQILAQ